jgi:hypothetical protein
LNLASTVKKCKADDNQCIIETINDIFKNKINGIPEIGLSSLDPLKIGAISFINSGNDKFNLVFNFTKAHLLGLNGAEVYKVDGFENPSSAKNLEIRMKVPYLSLIGPYQVDGKILQIPIEASADGNITLPGLDVKMMFKLKTVEISGNSHLQIGDNNIDFEATG